MTDETQIVLVETQEEQTTRLALIDPIRAALELSYNMVQGLPDEQKVAAQELLIAGWNSVMQLNDALSLMVNKLMQAGALVDAAAESNKMLLAQRDHIADELGKLATAIEKRDTKHPIIKELMYSMYQDAMETHNEAFWESLPYDMATIMGNGWQHYDAQKLYDVLMTDFEYEGDPEDFGWTQSQVNQFRADLLKLIREMSDGDE
jgi:hypothetical protein